MRPEWIDYNGHMNVAYYAMVADHACDAVFDHVGIGHDYVQRENKSVFVIDMRTAYLQELTVGEEIRVLTQLVDLDEKRFQMCHVLEQAATGEPSAISEWVGVHVDLAARRSTPFPDGVLAMLRAIRAAHAGLERPAAMTRPFGMG